VHRETRLLSGTAHGVTERERSCELVLCCPAGDGGVSGRETEEIRRDSPRRFGQEPVARTDGVVRLGLQVS
jgi:hypothetical protein